MAHHNTIFSQLLQLVDRHDFRKIEEDGFKPKRKYRKLSRWGQFAAMMFAQITKRSSLRDLESHFAAQSGKLYHLGAKTVKRSTLADANNNRDPKFFQALFDRIYRQCQGVAPKHKFRFKNRLYSMDSSTVDLCLSLFPWASFRSTKGGVKVHTLLDHDGYIPAFAQVTDAKTSDIAIARTLSLPPRSILVADRAYVDFSWFYEWHQNKKYFVTRMKKKIQYQVVERRSVLKSKGITSDQVIRLTGSKGGDCPILLRRVGYRDPETKKHYVFLTNIFKLCAKTIADIYKDRWQIELFFKWIKQNLRVKIFFGSSRNAVLTQILIAMITALLLVYYKWRAKLGHSMSEILKLLQLTLFERRNLYELFDPPLEQHKSGGQSQLSLNFNNF